MRTLTFTECKIDKQPSGIDDVLTPIGEKTIDISKGVDINAFLTGSKIVVDLIDPKKGIVGEDVYYGSEIPEELHAQASQI